MKLRNLMYATMVACAFASCSNDDVIDNGPDAKGDASLTIDLGTKTTKTAITTGDLETTVNDINIFLCNEDGSVKSKIYINSDIKAQETVTFTDLTVGETLYCVGFANMGREMNNIEQNGVINANGLVATNLPMHGLTEKVQIKEGVNNTDLTLIRDLARVELVSVTLDMGHTNNDVFTAGTFNFDFVSASVNHTPKSSTVTYATIDVARQYAVANEFLGGLSSWKWNELENASQLNNYIVSDSETNNATYIIGSTNGAQTVTKPASVVFYVLPNVGGKTALTLNGSMNVVNAVRDGQIINTTYDSFYNIEIGKDGEVSSNKGEGILPNKNYKISLIVTGIGGGAGGDRPSLVVNTLVEAWEEITEVVPVK